MAGGGVGPVARCPVARGRQPPGKGVRTPARAPSSGARRAARWGLGRVLGCCFCSGSFCGNLKQEQTAFPSGKPRSGALRAAAVQTKADGGSGQGAAPRSQQEAAFRHGRRRGSGWRRGQSCVTQAEAVCLGGRGAGLARGGGSIRRSGRPGRARTRRSPARLDSGPCRGWPGDRRGDRYSLLAEGSTSD